MKKAQILVPFLMVVFQAVSNAEEPLSITVERLGSGPIITPEMDERYQKSLRELRPYMSKGEYKEGWDLLRHIDVCIRFPKNTAAL